VVPTDLGEEPPGATPLEDEELEGLKQSWITNRSDLNEAEADNILSGQNKWTKRRNKLDRILDDKTVRDIHKDLFGQVWSWAGTYRRTEKTIGIDPIYISVEVRNLVEDAKYWFAENSNLSVDAAAARFHHKLVAIHPFANGNGRHSRFMTDLVLRALEAPEFTWGGSQGNALSTPTEVRARYLAALRAGDIGNYKPLLAFVRS
jgi:Fic-DOC domain mobile mystery protein B